jgi:hypothetical protein
MHFLFLAFRTYPFWAVPVALVSVQIGIHFRRRESRFALVWWGLSVSLIVGALAWIIFRGDLHANEWLAWVVS